MGSDIIGEDMSGSIPASLVVCGLPGSGKTTYLAALWHLIQSREVETALELQSLAFGEYEYVNAIRDRWQRGEKQIRTVGVAKPVGLDLRSRNAKKLRLVFLDHSGETFDQMWGSRSCTTEMAESLRSRSGIVMFLRSEGIKEPVPLSDMLRTEREMVDALPGSSVYAANKRPKERAWLSDDAPDQVKIIDLLQSLAQELSVGHRERLAIIVSAWDRVSEYETAETFVSNRMPLLSQFLCFADDRFDIRYYAVSAQGGEYVEDGYSGAYPEDLSRLLSLDNPSERICLSGPRADKQTDLTIPLEWMIGEDIKECAR